MRTTPLLLFFALIFTIPFSGEAQRWTFKVQKDTLEALQGDWGFDYIQIEDKRSSRRGDWYATSMVVEQDGFIRRLSEASCSGKIIQAKGKFFFETDSKIKESGGFQDGELVFLKKDKLEIRFLNDYWPFEPQQDSVNIVYGYYRIRQ